MITDISVFGYLTLLNPGIYGAAILIQLRLFLSYLFLFWYLVAVYGYLTQYQNHNLIEEFYLVELLQIYIIHLH